MRGVTYYKAQSGELENDIEEQRESGLWPQSPAGAASSLGNLWGQHGDSVGDTVPSEQGAWRRGLGDGVWRCWIRLLAGQGNQRSEPWGWMSC